MANEKEFSLVRGKDSIPGESINVDLAQKQFADVDTLGAAAWESKSQRPVNVVPLFRKK